ncbi:complement decay-accelerating factor isoform X3 [Mustela putorius furo]|uniref:Complement decay-accelerating factor isoform X3 n=1 Tax=Mustela putorius furo TaxID=9669 RepID=A0A8U0SIP0_MUSPF|nr:complement decay-accelerating factor isoform X3 [Mustela putorius furo]
MSLLGGLSAPPPLLLLPLLLLLLLCPPTAQGDCSFPPEVPNAIQSVGDRQSFPEETTVTYKCKEGFVKVPGKADSVVCLNNKWSEVAEFCNRSCDVPTRLQFASLKKSFTKQNYFPVGSIVEYECRPGYQRDHLLSGKLTCLPNFTWSKPDEFCKRKSCPNPGDLRHGHVSIPTDILYAAVIHFSCNEGYRLVGAASSYCSIVKNDVGWSDPLPECQEIFCPEPPKISNGVILDQQNTYVYQQAVKYECIKGFTLIGENSIYCTVKGDQGEWSGPPPECKGSQISTVILATETPTTVSASATKPTSTPQKPTTANVTGTKVTSAPQKPTTGNVPGTEATSTPQKPTTADVSETPPASQNPIMANASATQAMPATHRSSTAKASFTQSLPATRKSTAIHAPVTKGLHTTKRLTSARITAKQSSATPRTTSAPHGRGTLSSDAAIIAVVSLSQFQAGSQILVFLATWEHHDLWKQNQLKTTLFLAILL